MASANSMTFETDKDTLFAATLQIIKDAGYIIAETDDAAKRLVYVAQMKKSNEPDHRFEVIVTVSGTSQQSAMVSIKASDTLVNNEKQADTNFENQLILFVLNELRQQYQIISQATVRNAPGAGGNVSGRLSATTRRGVWPWLNDFSFEDIRLPDINMLLLKIGYIICNFISVLCGIGITLTILYFLIMRYTDIFAWLFGGLMIVVSWGAVFISIILARLSTEWNIIILNWIIETTKAARKFNRS